MSGAAIARQLLLASSNLFSAVPAARVVVGVVPQGTALPCIGITEVASTDNAPVRGNRPRRFDEAFWWGDRPITMVTAVVQLTVMAATYPACKDAMRQLRRALRDYVGDVGDFKGITCRLDGQGPDFQSEEGLYVQTQDVRIIYHESSV